PGPPARAAPPTADHQDSGRPWLERVRLAEVVGERRQGEWPPASPPSGIGHRMVAVTAGAAARPSSKPGQHLHTGVRKGAAVRFSVLLPTRNRLEYLRLAIETVRRQDYQDWEIIVSDNDSEQDVEGWIAGLY